MTVRWPGVVLRRVRCPEPGVLHQLRAVWQRKDRSRRNESGTGGADSSTLSGELRTWNQASLVVGRLRLLSPWTFPWNGGASGHLWQRRRAGGDGHTTRSTRDAAGVRMKGKVVEGQSRRKIH